MYVMYSIVIVLSVACRQIYIIDELIESEQQKEVRSNMHAYMHVLFSKIYSMLLIYGP